MWTSREALRGDGSRFVSKVILERRAVSGPQDCAELLGLGRQYKPAKDEASVDQSDEDMCSEELEDGEAVLDICVFP